MLFQPVIMVDFSIYMHKKGQNSATSTAYNFETKMMTTSFFAWPEQAMSELPTTNFGEILKENILVIYIYKLILTG